MIMNMKLTDKLRNIAIHLDYDLTQQADFNQFILELKSYLGVRKLSNNMDTVEIINGMLKRRVFN